ncbi:MAG: tyrosine--tRNA ligase, partial [Myxococcales bacterium]|nr:tyrosine--tRNA ligase [Myxococcales bacterium]
MMERDDFKRRWNEQRSISVHELLYPLAQAYDSVELKCDVELGGTDQLFNLMVGREIMRESKLKPQVVMTTPILEGLSAKEEGGRVVGDKMSKSLDNYVGVNESPKEQFGKLMSIADAVMWRYYELLSKRAVSDIARLKQDCQSGAVNPKEAKVALAKEIVERFHSAADADRAHQEWEAQFSRHEVPVDLAEKEVDAEGDSLWIAKAMVGAGLVPSTSEARRRIEQGGVQVDGERVSDVQAKLPAGGRYVIKAGKRAWAAVTVRGK